MVKSANTNIYTHVNGVIATVHQTFMRHSNVAKGGGHHATEEDLLAASGNSRRADVAVQSLDYLPLALLHNRAATEDLRCLSGTVLERLGGLHLGQRTLTCPARAVHDDLDNESARLQ